MFEVENLQQRKNVVNFFHHTVFHENAKGKKRLLFFLNEAQYSHID